MSTLVYVSGTGVGPDADWRPGFLANLHARLGETPERLARRREPSGDPDVERECAVLQWSAEFEDREHALDHAGRMAEPWFGIDQACSRALNDERERTWGTPDLRAACAALDVPVLIIDGARDLRPRTAVDSLAEALPRVRRVILPEAGHLPWAEDPDGFREAIAGWVAR
ncbi:alpha/beta hydrolase [Streptomyces sp. NPDC052109]|uniref:alpha/beta fold hydrolase n=1 Tax=Streptomyces sp. NPDC052109 TaxID=3155527 RepID=UPI003414135C